MSSKLDKIKKLLALSKSPNEQEAANALALAMQYAADEGVELDELGLDDDDILAQDYSLEPQSKKIEKWKSFFWSQISKIFGCAVFFSSFYDKKKLHLRNKIKIVGRKSDIDIADYVGVYLQRELLRLCRKEIASVCKRRKLSRSQLRNSFLLGAAMRVINLAAKIFERDPQSKISTGYDLIVSRAAKAKAFIDSKKDLTPVKYKSKVDSKAYDSGFSRAHGISITKGLASTAGNPRKQIGAVNE